MGTLDQTTMYGTERVSLCGSMFGETLTSRRRLTNCSLRTNGMKVAKHTNDDKENSKKCSRTNSVCLSVSDSLASNTLNHGEKRRRINNSFHSYRFLVVLFGGMSLGLMLVLRLNVTVAILTMVNQTAIYMSEHPNNTVEDYYAEGYVSGEGEFEWNNEIQMMIMSYYMIAYTLPQLPFTKLYIKLGNKWSVPISLLICSLSTIFTPIVAYLGWEYVIALRLINGVGATAVLPMMLNLIEDYMPYDEITLGLTFAQLTQSIILASSPLIVGYLSSIHWSYAFYAPAAVTIVFSILWLIFIADSPDENPFMSEKEINIICGYSGDDAKDINNCSKHDESAIKSGQKKEEELNAASEEAEAKPIWSDIFRVPSFYAYALIWCFYCSSSAIFFFILPTYLRQYYKFPISENGFYTTTIMLGSLLSVLHPHPVLRFLQEKLKFSQTASRRLIYLVVCTMVGLTWFYVGLFHSNQLIVLFINRVFHNSTDIVVVSTLMGNFAKVGLSGIAFSAVNTVGNFSVVLSSTLTGYILDNTGSSDKGWTYIYFGLAGSQLVVLFIFSIFIKSDPIEFKKKRNSTEKKTADDLDNLDSISVRAAKTEKSKC